VAFARGFLKVADFINQTEARCQQRLHLTAHSMGNYVLRHALQELKRQVGNQLPRLFDQVLMMAADEDDDAFDSRLQIVVSVPHHPVFRTSVYFNRNDLALLGKVISLRVIPPVWGQIVQSSLDNFLAMSIRSIVPCCGSRVLPIPSEHGYYLNVPLGCQGYASSIRQSNSPR
jgi:hypothetical protein